MTWNAYLGLTMKGAVGPRIRITAGSFDQVLNDHDNVSITTPLEDLEGVEKKWYTYRSGAIVLTYTDMWGIEHMMTACPISSPPKQDRGEGTVTFECEGVGSIFEDRLVVDEGTGLFGKDLTRAEYAAAMKNWRKRKLSLTNCSFRGICTAILEEGMKKPNGYLPIELPTDGLTGTHTRNYEAWNVMNNWCWKRIVEVTEVIGGPDVAFRTEWTDETHTSWRWVFVCGTDAQQTLPQVGEAFWDSTSPRTSVEEVQVTSKATNIAHKSYVMGAGEGAAISYYISSQSTIAEDMPLIQHAAAIAGEGPKDENGELTGQSSPVLEAAADAEIRSQGTDQIEASIIGDGRDGYPIGTWQIGELATLKVAGWLNVPDGEHLLRIVQTKFDLNSDKVQVSFQEDALGGDYIW